MVSIIGWGNVGSFERVAVLPAAILRQSLLDRCRFRLIGASAEPHSGRTVDQHAGERPV
jgi:hypothetical protein